MKNVLLIEDDHDLVKLLKIHLTELNLAVSYSGDGLKALEMVLHGSYDLIVLDIMLPGLDGVSILQSLRSKGITTPIMLLTARSEEIDKVVGLESGADDYITKPFSVREFTARVKAILRRQKMGEQSAESSNSLIQHEDLELDIKKRRVKIAGKELELTPKEFDLLVLLAENPGISYGRKQLLSTIWGFEFSGYEHTVNSHINRLRAKLEPDLNCPKYVLTTWGVGYRFNDQLN